MSSKCLVEFISGLVVLGAVQAVSIVAAGAAGVVGGVGAGIVAQTMWQDASLVDRNYKEVFEVYRQRALPDLGV